MWTKQDVECWVDAHMEEAIVDLIRIVNIKSVAELDQPEVKPFGKGCRDVLTEMLSMGKEAGFSVHDYDGYVGCISLNEKEEDIGIWAHLDVVEEGDGWQYDPYQACVKEGYVIGRGANDNKSSAVMGFYLLRFFRENGIDLSRNLRLYLGTCEEQGMHDLDYFTSHYPCPSVSLVPDSGFPVCCGERGSWNGTIRSQEPLSEDVLEFYTSDRPYSIPELAVLRLRDSEERRMRCRKLPDGICAEYEGESLCLTARGTACSAAQPQNGVSALGILLQAVHACGLLSSHDDAVFCLARKLSNDSSGRALRVACEDELSGPLVLSVTAAKLCGRKLEYSFVSKYPVTKNEVDFTKIAGEVCAECGMELQITRYDKASYFNPEDRLARVMTEAYNDYMGAAEQPFVMSGGTYARKLPNAFACGTGMPEGPRPKTLFLPGHGDYHQPDEAISVERIRSALVIYILGILKYCSQDPEHVF